MSPRPTPRRPASARRTSSRSGSTEAPVAQGANRLENGTQQVPFYGYDGNGSLLPVFPSWTEATKTEPDKNTYLVLDGQKGADAELRLRHPLPLPGPRGRRRRGLPHAHQPRCRRRAPRDADGDTGQRRQPTCPTSTAARGIPSPGACSSPRRRRQGRRRLAGDARRARRRSTTSPASPAQGGYEGIQNDSDGNALDRRGRRRPNGTAQRQARQAAQQLRLPLHAQGQDRPDQGRQARGAAGHVAAQRPADRLPRRRRPTPTSQSQDMKDLHTYGNVLKTQVGDRPRHRDRRHRAVHRQRRSPRRRRRTPFKRPENGLFRPGTRLPRRSSSTRPATPTTAPRPAATTAASAPSRSSTQHGPSADRGTLRLVYQGDQDTRQPRQRAFLARDKVRVRRGRGRRAARPAQRAGLRLRRSTPTSTTRAGAQPVRFLAEGRDALGDDRLRPRRAEDTGFQNEGDNEITGIHVSDGDPTAGGTARRQGPDALRGRLARCSIRSSTATT